MVEGMVGGIVWFLANALYADMKRKGRTGFSRLILFWMGLPMSFLLFLLLPEGSVPEMEEPPDDADALLAEIRRDRQLRPGSSPEDRGI